MNTCNHFNPPQVPVYFYSYENELRGFSNTCANCAARALLPFKEDLLPSFRMDGFQNRIYADISKSHYTIKNSVILSSVYFLNKVFLGNFVHFIFSFFEKETYTTTCIWAKTNIFPTTYLDYTFKLGLNKQIQDIIDLGNSGEILPAVKKMQLFEDKFTKIIIFSTMLFFLIHMNRGINRKELKMGSIFLLSHTVVLLSLHHLFKHSAENLVYGSENNIDLNPKTMTYVLANSSKELLHYLTFAIFTIGLIGFQIKQHTERCEKAIRELNSWQAHAEILNGLTNRKICLKTYIA
jgi:hypothetical protein